MVRSPVAYRDHRTGGIRLSAEQVLLLRVDRNVPFRAIVPTTIEEGGWMSSFDTVLARYEQRASEESRLWAAQSDPTALLDRRDEFLLHVGEETARLLHALVVGRGATRLLELGTSYGYSTLFLADAARRAGGTLTTVDIDASKQEYARTQLADARLDHVVNWRCGDALALLEELDGPFDFVLLDIWKELYVPCFERVVDKLADGALLAADNMLEPAIVLPEAEAYRTAVRTRPELQTVLLPIGSGIELSCVWRTPPA
jgi:predicted O-methyltransferase YrrM